MERSSEEILLSPDTEAERLWQRAKEAFESETGDIVSLIEAVDFGIRVVEINTVRCLQKVRYEFPATITSLLEMPPPEIDPERDFVNPPKSLRFVDVVDLLSDEKLTCVARPLHHGWEDRRESCRRAREWTLSATGISLSEEQRKALMRLGAYRNRIFSVPPPVRIVPREINEDYPVLVEVVVGLLDAIALREGETVRGEG